MPTAPLPLSHHLILTPKKRQAIIAKTKSCNSYERLIIDDDHAYVFHGTREDMDGHHHFEFTLTVADELVTSITGYYFPWMTEAYRDHYGPTPEGRDIQIFEAYDVTGDAHENFAAWFAEPTRYRKEIEAGRCGSAHIREVTTAEGKQGQGYAHKTLVKLLELLPDFKRIRYVTLSALMYANGEVNPVAQPRWENYFVTQLGFQRPPPPKTQYTLLKILA